MLHPIGRCPASHSVPPRHSRIEDEHRTLTTERTTSDDTQAGDLGAEGSSAASPSRWLTGSEVAEGIADHGRRFPHPQIRSLAEINAVKRLHTPPRGKRKNYWMLGAGGACYCRQLRRSVRSAHDEGVREGQGALPLN